MRNILHLNAGNETGGGMHHILSLLEQFNRAEFTLGVFEKGEMLERAKALGIRTVYFPNESRVSLPLLRNIRHYIRKNNVDYIHTHGPRANVYANLLKAVIPAYWVVTVHSDPLHDFKGQGMKGSIFTHLNLRAIKNAHKIIAISEQFRTNLRKNGVANEKIVTALNGIDFKKEIEQCHVRDDFGIDEDAFIFLKVARFERVKGHDVALRAFSKIVERWRHAHLILLGDGTLMEQMKAEAKQLGISHHVHFLGHRDDVERFYQMADVTILTSHSESFPLVLLESARAKTPVISTNVGGVNELIKDDSFGWMTEPGNVQELEKAMKDAVILHKKGSLFTIGEKIHAHASTKFSVEKFAKNVYNVYLSMKNEKISL